MFLRSKFIGLTWESGKTSSSKSFKTTALYICMRWKVYDPVLLWSDLEITKYKNPLRKVGEYSSWNFVIKQNNRYTGIIISCLKTKLEIYKYGVIGIMEKEMVLWLSFNAEVFPLCMPWKSAFCIFTFIWVVNTDYFYNWKNAQLILDTKQALKSLCIYLQLRNLCIYFLFYWMKLTN